MVLQFSSNDENCWIFSCVLEIGKILIFGKNTGFWGKGAVFENFSSSRRSNTVNKHVDTPHSETVNKQIHLIYKSAEIHTCFSWEQTDFTLIHNRLLLIVGNVFGNNWLTTWSKAKATQKIPLVHTKILLLSCTLIFCLVRFYIYSNVLWVFLTQDTGKQWRHPEKNHIKSYSIAKKHK